MAFHCRCNIEEHECKYPDCHEGRWDAEQKQRTETAKAADEHPLAKRCYLMSESHLSGHRLVVGFETLEDAQAAHSFVAHLTKTPNAGGQVRR